MSERVIERVAEPGPDTASELARAGRALARAGLVTAFGHVSVRTAPDRLLMTPPCPLGTLDPAAPRAVEIAVDADELPAGAPREAWMHVAIASARPDVGAVCRAQPRGVTAAVAAGVPLVALHGQAALLGTEVRVHRDPRLVRDHPLGLAVAQTLADSSACVLRGNGALTTGRTLGEAVARMWILEETARTALLAAAAGTPEPLTGAEADAWRATGAELLERLWQYLRSEVPVPEVPVSEVPVPLS